MTNYIDIAQLYYSVTNCIIAMGMASVAIAVAIGLIRQKAQYQGLTIFLGLLFGVLSVSRFFKV